MNKVSIIILDIDRCYGEKINQKNQIRNGQTHQRNKRETKVKKDETSVKTLKQSKQHINPYITSIFGMLKHKKRVQGPGIRQSGREGQNSLEE